MAEIGSINARLRARKQHFLKSDVYEALVKNYSHSYIIDHLLGSRYGNFLKPYLIDNDCAPVDKIRNSMQDFGEKEVNNILKNCDEKTKIILLYFLIKWDLTAIKAIFCSKIDGSVIENRLYAGVLNYKEIKDLIAATFTEGIRLFENHKTGLLSMFCPIILKFEMTKNKEEFCRELDRIYFEFLFSNKGFGSYEGEILKNLMSIELDRKNTMEVLLMLETGMQSKWKPSGYYGFLKEMFFKSMIKAKDVEEALQKLMRSPYEQQVVYGLLPFELTGELNYIERLIEKKWLVYLKKNAMLNPLSIAVPIYYISLLKNEYSNIMTIVLGEQFGIVQNLVRRNLIVV